MQIVERIKNSSYFRQIASLATGTAIAQAITILAYVLLTRLYSVEDFGSFKLFESIIYVLVILSTLAFEHAIVLPKHRRTALSIFSTALLFTILFSVFCSLILLLFKPFIAPYIELDTKLIHILPMGILFIGVINSFSNWYVYSKQYTRLSGIKVVQSVSTAFIQIGIGFWQLLPFGLITGFLTGRFIAIMAYINKSTIRLKELLPTFRKSNIRSVFEDYKEQPKYLMPAKLVQQLSLEIPVLLTSYLFNNLFLGLLALALKALSTPTQFIGISVGQVYYKQISDRFNNNGGIKDLLLKTWGGLFLVGIIPFGLLTFFGGTIFSIVFGADWYEAGQIAAILSPALLVYFVIGPTERATFMVLGLQNRILQFVIIELTAKTAGMLVGFYYQDFMIAIMAISILQALTLLSIGIYLLISVNRYHAELEKTPT